MALRHTWLLVTGLLGLGLLRPAWADPTSHRYLWGQVLDSESHRPVAGVTVTETPGPHVTETDSQGYFWMIVDGTALRLGRPGYVARTVTITAPGVVLAPSTPLPAGRRPLMASGQVLSLEPDPKPAHAGNWDTRRYRWGTVVDAESGVPLAGITVTDPLASTSATTDAAGRFWVVATSDRLTLQGPGYDEKTVTTEGSRLVVGDSGDATPGRRPLATSGERLTLRSSRAPIFSTQASLGWTPDVLSESTTHRDGTEYQTLGLRIPQGRLDGAARLGPLYVTGHYGLRPYAMQRGDTLEVFGRWQQEAEVAPLLCLVWQDRFGLAVGPSVLVDRTDVVNPPAPRGRTIDYLDVPVTRLAYGLTGYGAVALPLPWPVALDARIGVWPVTTVFSGTPNLVSDGLWTLGGDVGLRWFVGPHLAVDGRYAFQSWQGSEYGHGHQGLTLGMTAAW